MSKKILKLSKSRGMTLVELLIYLAITMIVLVVVIDLVTRVAQVKSHSVGQEEISSNARFLTDRITYAVQASSSIDGSYPSNNLNLTVNGLATSFSLNNGQIFYTEGFGSPAALTNTLVEIIPPQGGYIFTKITNGSSSTIQVTFQVRFKQNNFTRDFQTSVLERGK